MSAEPSTVLITGANRGLGLGLVREFAVRGWRVFAACRGSLDTASSGCADGASDVRPVEIDVVNADSVRAAAGEVSHQCAALDVLVNNAGVNPEPREAGVETVSPSAVLAAFDVNAVGPIRVTQAFLPLLRRSARARVVNMSSGAGSLTRNPLQRSLLPYSLSKAALNLFTRRAADELRSEGIVVVSVSPGWVRTDMGGEGATLSVSESAAALAATIDNLGLEQSGQWLDRFGQLSEFAW